jgi:hypothetical protein
MTALVTQERKPLSFDSTRALEAETAAVEMAVVSLWKAFESARH